MCLTIGVHFNYRSIQPVSEESTLQLLSRIEKEAARLSWNDTEKFIQPLKEKLQQFDIAARTVDSVLYPTREQAALAQKDYDRIQSLLKNGSLDTEESALQLYEKIKNTKFETNAADAYIQKVEKAVQTFDEQYRTVEGTLYETRNKADEARAEYELMVANQKLQQLEVAASTSTAAAVTDNTHQAEAREVEAIAEREPLTNNQPKPEKRNIVPDTPAAATNGPAAADKDQAKYEKLVRKATKYEKRKRKGFFKRFLWHFSMLILSLFAIGYTTGVAILIIVPLYIIFTVRSWNQKRAWKKLTNKGKNPLLSIA